MKPKVVTVFRAKGPSKVGTPCSVQPGDWLDFWLDGPLRGRYVASVHKGHIMTEPMRSKYGLLDGPRKVLFKDFYIATRKVGEPKQEPKPKPQPEPESKPKSKKRKKRKRKPPMDLVAFLDDGYKE
jgi:hypothetical protein